MKKKTLKHKHGDFGLTSPYTVIPD